VKDNLLSEKPSAVVRPWSLILVATMELVLGVFCAATAAYLLLRSSFAAVVVACVAVVAFASAVGLFRRAKLGWWIAAVSNLLIAAALLWDAFSEQYIDVAEIITGAIFLCLVALLFLRPTRRGIFAPATPASQSAKTQ